MPRKKKEGRMLTNEIKKGTWIMLKNGWRAQIMDNARGDIRMADVYGFAHEMGSIYATDIAFVADEQGDEIATVEFTEKQLKSKRLRAAMGF